MTLARLWKWILAGLGLVLAGALFLLRRSSKPDPATRIAEREVARAEVRVEEAGARADEAREERTQDRARAEGMLDDDLADLDNDRRHAGR